ncbi:pectate lyase [Fusarium sporotrichioides]|uniref:Pectate lyase n=1 Tax=Fusarium sporotrichioides TaxID=5514 RepID=A0A395SJG3_FUSSP|nr:pectate lyase [Fusarium sporotrichioides]
MRISIFLTIANFGTAFAAVQVYNQCGGSAYSGDTECPSGSTCVEASKWYSQCIPDSSSKKAASVEKTDFDFPAFGFPGFPAPPQAPPTEDDNNQGGDNVSTPFPPVVPTEEPVDTPEEPVAEPVDTVIANPTAAPTNEPVGTGSGSGSGSGGITRTIPASSGAIVVVTAIPVSGELDGGMAYYDRSPAVCKEQEETGEADAMFILEDGATLRNVIIGPGQAEGVHCKGTCTLENVWFEDVCEDAITLKQKSGTSIIRGGGAFHAADKVVQFNGRGTVEISDFYVEDYGKLVRSCGNCKDNGGPRNVIIENIAAVNGGVLCGINTNYGDTCTISNACQDEGKNCDLFEGNSDGSEPTKLSSGPDGTSCKIDSFAETC